MTNFTKLLAAGVIAVFVAVFSVSYSISTHQVPSASAAQSDYFLKIDGVENEIEIQSFSWGVSSPRDVATGQSSGKRQYQPLIIRKRIDKASPLLLRSVGDKKYIGHVTIVKRSTDGTTNEYTVAFTDVLVTSYQNEGVQGSSPTETVSFTFQKIEMK